MEGTLIIGQVVTVMRTKLRLFQYQAYRGMLLSFIFLTALIVALICVTLFALFARSSLRDASKISESMLGQTSYAANIFEEQAYEIGNYLINNRTFISSLYSKQVDYIEEFHTVNALKTLETTYPYIEFIGLYNGYTHRYVNTKGITAEHELALLQQLGSPEKKVYGRLFPRQLTSPGLGTEKKLLTFVLQPGFNSYLPKDGAIVINFSADYINKLIGGLQNKNANYLIAINTDGVVLGHSKGGHFLDSFEDKNYIRRILSASTDVGSFTDNVDGQMSHVSYVKSEQLDWYFVSVSPIKDLFFNINNLKNKTLTIAFIIFGIGIFMSIWLTNQNYSPIQRLFHKIIGASGNALSANKRINEFYMMDQLYSAVSQKATELKSAVEIARRSSLLNYLTGSQSDLTNRYFEPLKGPNYNMIVLRIDAMDQFKQRHSEQMQSLIRFGICNIAQEWISADEGANETEVIIVNEQEIGVLIQMNQAHESPEMLLRLNEVQRTVKDFFKLSLTVGIGSIEERPEQIRNSYHKAKDVSHSRFFLGPGQIFKYDDNADSAAAELDYPDNAEKKLIESIQLSRPQDMKRAIEQFAMSIRSVSYHQVLYGVQHLLTSLNKQFNLMGAAVGEQRELFAKMTFHVAVYETWDALASDLIVLCNAIGEQLGERSKNRNVEVMQSVKAYIDCNYWKPDISVEFLADYVGLTPGYLGRLFKIQYNQSVNDYLKDVRLEFSKRLLLDSDDSVQTISEKAGIYNTTYFYTLFRKKYGVSPVQFRNEITLTRQKSEK